MLWNQLSSLVIRGECVHVFFRFPAGSDDNAFDLETLAVCIWRVLQREGHPVSHLHIVPALISLLCLGN